MTPISSVSSTSSHSNKSDNKAIINISHGTLVGVRGEKYDYFLGIPYAQAPVGKLRYQLPQPALPWEGQYDATIYGTPCPSPMIYPSLDLAKNIRSDNNWLTLNIWTPKNAQQAAVFVWIHGGGLASGSNADQLYNGDRFAENGIVYVNINYRLGIEGFGIFPDAPNNRGIADQILALKWVRDNIAAFGGDPNNITIGGQSAGARSTIALITSPEAQGLFHRAIAQSAFFQKLSPDEGIKTYVHEVAAELNIQATAKDFSSLTTAQVITAETVIVQKPRSPRSIATFSPIIDGSILPEEPMTFLRKNPPHTPLLIGYTGCEFAWWVRIAKIFGNITEDNLAEKASVLGIDKETVDAYIKYYDSINVEYIPKADEIFMHLINDKYWVSPIHDIINRWPEYCYAYRFLWENPHNDFCAFHTIELPFMFDHLDSPAGKGITGKDAPQELANHIHTAWVNFIKTGKPGWDIAGKEFHHYDFDYPHSSAQTNEPKTELLAL